LSFSLLEAIDRTTLLIRAASPSLRASSAFMTPLTNCCSQRNRERKQQIAEVVGSGMTQLDEDQARRGRRRGTVSLRVTADSKSDDPAAPGECADRTRTSPTCLEGYADAAALRPWVGALRERLEPYSPTVLAEVALPLEVAKISARGT
jgi:hypothetical protein